MSPSSSNVKLFLDTDLSVDEEKLFEYLKGIGQTRRIWRLNLRISYLFEDYEVWFGAIAFKALRFFT